MTEAIAPLVTPSFDTACDDFAGATVSVFACTPILFCAGASLFATVATTLPIGAARAAGAIDLPFTSGAELLVVVVGTVVGVVFVVAATRAGDTASAGAGAELSEDWSTAVFGRAGAVVGLGDGPDVTMDGEVFVNF